MLGSSRRPAFLAPAASLSVCLFGAVVLVGAGQPANAGGPPVGKAYTMAPPVPAPGTCHARGVLPDPTCTPGATNPAVTQADISSTICKSGWTATVRPPETYTEALKARQMAAYAETGPMGNYEEDHLVPLELGGAPSDPRNLWPEYGASPNRKDRVEGAANAAVCSRQMSLASAQVAIATNWVTLGERLGLGDLATKVPAPPPVRTTTTVASSPGEPSNTSPSGHYYRPGEYCPHKDLDRTITDPYGVMKCEEPAGGGQPRWERTS